MFKKILRGSITLQQQASLNEIAHNIVKKGAFTQRHTFEIKERDHVIRSRVDLSTEINTKYASRQNGIISILQKEYVAVG